MSMNATRTPPATSPSSSSSAPSSPCSSRRAASGQPKSPLLWPIWWAWGRRGDESLASLLLPIRWAPGRRGWGSQVHLNHHFYGWLGQSKKGEEPQAHLNNHSCGCSGGPEAYYGWDWGLPKSPLWWLIKWACEARGRREEAEEEPEAHHFYGWLELIPDLGENQNCCKLISLRTLPRPKNKWTREKGQALANFGPSKYVPERWVGWGCGRARSPKT